ncbi:MAG: hypothetical protein CL398_09780 [Acidiferrobacteraceae bacterium]|nr:hypothetical protein [Acidiferrobacteraceae bacterium]|tara:strand:- start:1294 stop:1755 length:462 start_codon:yes stop_codon:yes gene_type:complete
MATELPIPKTLEDFNLYGRDYIFGRLDMEFLQDREHEVIGQIVLSKYHFGWNDNIHEGTIFALADSCAGYGCVCSLPDGATGFATIETKTNFLATINYGKIKAVAVPMHQGSSTQVWDVKSSSVDSGKLLSCYLCAQMILWPSSKTESVSRDM